MVEPLKETHGMKRTENHEETNAYFKTYLTTNNQFSTKNKQHEGTKYRRSIMRIKNGEKKT